MEKEKLKKIDREEGWFKRILKFQTNFLKV